jgi:hypothetical protein
MLRPGGEVVESGEAGDPFSIDRFSLCIEIQGRHRPASVGPTSSVRQARQAGESFVSRRNSAPMTIVIDATITGYQSPL